VQIGIRDASSLSYIPGLDGVRAIAVLVVMTFHFTAGFVPQLRLLGVGWQVFAGVAGTGWVGVDIFFVLSGYLIAKVLETRPVSSIAGYSNFIGRRFRRLAPPYIFCLLVFGAVAWLFVPGSKAFNNQYLLWTLTSNIEASFGDRNALGDPYFSLVHFWSLAVEWHFYLLFPLLVFMTGSVKRAAGVLVAAALACRMAFVHFGVSDNAIYSFSLCRADSLALGCLLACINLNDYKRYRSAAGLIGVLVFVALLSSLALDSKPFKMVSWLKMVGYTALSVAIAMMLFAVLQSSPQSKVTRALEQKWLVWIGRASYSLYIWHLVFFPWIQATVARQNYDIRLQYLLTLVISMSVSFLAGSISFRFIEAPFMRRRHLSKASVAST